MLMADGTTIWGTGAGKPGVTTGEICFNTSLTGYQEILTDPSYAGQVITFTFPHIGNTGANPEDMERDAVYARGLILRTDITAPSSWRATETLDEWLKRQELTALCGVDTRALTRRIRDKGAQNVAICYAPDKKFDMDAIQAALDDAPSMKGLDLASTVSCGEIHEWTETAWTPDNGFGELSGDENRHIVVIDYGAKSNIMRCLAETGSRVTVVPCDTDADTIRKLDPDGIMLSNGPGDPSATGAYAIPVIQELLATSIPVFGICLGHQILALALGAKTEKMFLGHRGANHPVKDIETGKIEVTSQNHGFVVLSDSLPENVEETHVSLFDGSNEGLRVKGKPVFSVQYHPEAAPGPQDSHYLFNRFIEAIDTAARKTA